MRKLFVTTATVAICARPCPQRSSGTATASARAAGATATSSCEIEDYSELWIGGTVGVDTTASGLAGNE